MCLNVQKVPGQLILMYVLLKSNVLWDYLCANV